MGPWNFSLCCAAGLMLGVSNVEASRSCPSPVRNAVQKAYPGAKIASCKREKAEGSVQYEVKVTKHGSRNTEIDVTPAGEILQTEEQVDLKSVPELVAKGFADKYPTMKFDRAEKQTGREGKVTYELAFTDKMKKHEATFSEDGAFIEEE